MFKVNDYVVYPGFGVGVVSKIDTKEILGKTYGYYCIDILDSGMKVMVPKGNSTFIGLRSIVSKTEAKQVLEILVTQSKLNNNTWNRRYREYMEKIKTGSIFEVAEVLRDLRNYDKELSFGERKMLDTARALINKELSIVLGKDINV